MAKRLPKLLVTGGAGFIGSEFVRQGVARGYKIAVVDKLTYAGDLKRLASVRSKIKFHKTDICRLDKMVAVVKAEKPDAVVHFATETHVDRSILDAKPFITSNILGTQVLIETALKRKVKKFVHISTDEVYGEIHRGCFAEGAALNPGNPYAASKAAADMLIKAAIRTHEFPAVIVRPSNNYGPWQYPEKFIPVVTLKALKNQKVPVYGRGKQRREWLYVGDCAEAIFAVLAKGRMGETYNVSSRNEQENIQTAKDILRLLGQPEKLIQFVKDRPGHDFRYCLDCRKIEKIGWRPRTPFRKGLAATVTWNRDHADWLGSKLGRLRKYWQKVYRLDR